MAPSHSPRQRQAPRPSSSSPYKRGSPSYGLLVPSKHSMLTRTQARYNRSELESPLVPTLGLLSPTLSSTAHILGGINHRRDERVPPSHNIFRPSKDSMHTRTEASIELEPSLVLPSALLPPIASSTDRILDVVHHHCGDMESFADAIKNMVSETHKEIDRCIRQEISTRDSQIEEKRRLAERKTELAKQLEVQMHELKLHHEEKELASREQLENCQAQLRVLQRCIQESRSAREEEYRCPICIDLAWNPHVLSCGHMFCARCISRVKFISLQSLERCRCPICRTYILRKPVPSLTIRHGVETVADAQGVTVPPLYRLQWPVRTSWPARS